MGLRILCPGYAAAFAGEGFVFDAFRGSVKKATGR